jgi:hypothetical protein
MFGTAIVRGKVIRFRLPAALEAACLPQVSAKTRLAGLRKARGIWKNRKDLSDFRTLRSELDRV